MVTPKPEAFKSNNPGYIRGKLKHNLSTPERVEVVNLKIGDSGFTYHISSIESLIYYVKNQAEHHKTESYKDELIRLLKEYDVDYIEYYLFI